MSRTPQIGVLALQGAVAEHEQALSAAGAQVRKVRRPAELEGLDGLVVPGGESTAMARLAAPVRLMPAIRQRHEEGMAVFGTCAGLILTADAVADAEALTGFERIGGLDVVVRRNAYGNQLASFETELEVSSIPESERRLPAVFIRAPIIEEITGSEVEVLAEAAGHPVVVRQGRLLAASFHPELTGDHRLHEHFVQLAAG
ncbi:pyridoxal 5'-phosphate synthase glutaminase subunit PdxT [Nesterenkonia alkaliphila]|uniref:Pyridoxal 5'-phosphate synthase subunit PdxT n=1 Tax=Nesterenkonia alkaliphila TaxID=1463631 RepID=A0A7K1UK69_9MICC|nr:pyridoxal 5'-phosphate synthase glutaminase subunit PdxT [Nesterenkonia alkaliphila]MVT26869.1 pyridoxal 5'-phosphate synthase glutaminase subunit PdxT [Nesterenkonia alkaliphila]GFZ82278.1 pyridoxal 5'-phosphate synthase subunit PdxT [Nesterenkonia alkaliphila]